MQGDCVEILPTILSHSIPIVITDLPSHIGLEYAGNFQDDTPYCAYLDWLKECLAEGEISKSTIHEEMARNHFRHDALEIVQQMAKEAA